MSFFLQPDDKESRFILSDVDGFPNARLEIASVNFDDAGNYMCLANSTKFSDMNANQTIHIRVKGKFKWFWGTRYPQFLFYSIKPSH